MLPRHSNSSLLVLLWFFCQALLSCAFLSNNRPAYPSFLRFSSHLRSTTTDAADISADNIFVMVNGMPGPMATAAAEACLRKGLRLCPFALTSPRASPSVISVSDGTKCESVRLVPSSTDRKELDAQLAGVRATLTDDDSLLLVIDYTHPDAVNGNAQWYVESDLPFVMGTTGGDREQLLATAQDFPCVIAPNMGKQIVALQAALEHAAATTPGAFAGYTLQVTESHQKTKADTSGTAKAVIQNLQTLTGDTPSFDIDTDLTMIRDDAQAIAFGVPEDAVTSGHAFHTYTLTSPDGSVQFSLQHNVAGRTVYAEGTADAVLFLAQRSGERRVFSMVDVLQAGALE